MRFSQGYKPSVTTAKVFKRAKKSLGITSRRAALGVGCPGPIAIGVPPRGNCAPRGKRTSRVAIVVRARTSGHQWVLRLVGAEPEHLSLGSRLRACPRAVKPKSGVCALSRRNPSLFSGASIFRDDFAAFLITPGMRDGPTVAPVGSKLPYSCPFRSFRCKPLYRQPFP